MGRPSAARSATPPNGKRQASKRNWPTTSWTTPKPWWQRDTPPRTPRTWRWTPWETRCRWANPLGWLVLARGLLVVMVVCLLILVFYGSDVVYRFDSWWDAKHDPLGTFQSSGSLNGSETDLPPTTLLDIKKELPGGSILHVYGVGAAAAPGDRKETIVYLYAVCYHRMPFLHAAYLPDLTFSCHGHTTSAEWRPNIGFFDVVYRLYPVYVPQDARKITLHYDHYGTRFALEIPLPQEEVRTP